MQHSNSYQLNESVRTGVPGRLLTRAVQGWGLLARNRDREEAAENFTTRSEKHLGEILQAEPGPQPTQGV